MNTRELLAQLGTTDFIVQPVYYNPAVHYTVIEPNETELVKMLEKDPSLVLATFDKTYDLSDCCSLNNTLLQLAFGARNYALCRILAPFYVKACGSLQAGRDTFLQQLKEKFSTEHEEEKKRVIKTQLAAMIAPVIEAISRELFDKTIEATTAIPHARLTLNVATKEAINHYNEALKILFPTEVDKGRYFHPETLIEALKLVDAKWNYNQRILYEDAVLAPILSRVPVVDGQHFSQGLCSLKEPRSLMVENGDSYYHSLKTPSWELDVNSSYVDPRSGIAASCFPRGLRIGPDMMVKTQDVVEAYYLESEKQLALIMQGKPFEDMVEVVAMPASISPIDDSKKESEAVRRSWGCVIS